MCSTKTRGKSLIRHGGNNVCFIDVCTAEKVIHTTPGPEVFPGNQLTEESTGSTVLILNVFIISI